MMIETFARWIVVRNHLEFKHGVTLHADSHLTQRQNVGFLFLVFVNVYSIFSSATCSLNERF